MPLYEPKTVRIRDEGVSQGDVTTLDFVGTGVTATTSGGIATVNISGGTWTLVEADLGSPHWRGKFTVTDASVSSSSKIIIQHAPGPYTGKGTLADEAEMDPLWCIAAPGSGQFTVHWRTLMGIAPSYPTLPGNGPQLNTTTSSSGMHAFKEHIVGKVTGNVKFLYTVR